jgi:hypothetical protein
MAIKTDTFTGGGGGGATPNLDAVTTEGATTTNSITVGGVTIGTEYSLPTLDGSANQVLQTNGTGTVSFATLDFTGGLEYKGSFNATAGTPSLANAEKGDFYIIDTAGTIYGQTWAVGDHLLINEDMGGTITNSKIDKIDNTQAVTSVNTQTGAVVISGNDVAADHTAVNYTATNANVDGHLAGIDSALGASASPTLDGVTTNGNTTTNSIEVGAVQVSGDITADTADTRTIGGEDTRFITTYSDLNGAIRFKAKNDEGVQITKGQAVYIKGLAGDGTTPTVGLADSNDASKMPAFGLAFNTANDQAEVQIVQVGNLGGLNTSGFSVGDTLYIDTTAGAVTNTKPTGETSQLQNIGRVIRSDNGDGVIMVGGAGRSAATPNLDQDKIFLGNASNQSVSTALSAIGLSKFNNDSGFLTNITNESLNDLSDVSFTAGPGIDNYVLTYDNGTSSWGAEVVPSAPVTSVNTLTGAVVISGNDVAADHTATNYTAGNANVDGHLSGIDTKFGTLGTASTQDVGTSANNVVQLDGTSRLPAVDGSQLTNLPSAPVTSVNTLTGAVVISGNDVAADHTATNYTATNSNVDGHLSGIDTKLGTLLADITSESLNDLSDVSYTAGAGIDNYVLTYDNGTSSWGAEAVPSAPVTSVNTQTGVVVISGNDIVADHTAVNYTAANANVDGHLSGIDTKLGTLGTAAFLDVGTSANNVVQLDGSSRLPAVDGSQLTNLPSGGYTYSAITADPANAQANYHYSCTGTFTITLPTTGVSAGEEIRVKNMGTGTITIDPQTSNIDGSTTDYTLDVQYSAITLVSDGTDWEII